MDIEATITVYEGERLLLHAHITPGEVQFGLVTPEKMNRTKGRPRPWLFWDFPRVGYVSPKDTGRLWWRRTQVSVGEAMQEVMAELHRREFLMREAESQVEATRATIRALAEIEKELSA